MKTLFHRLGSLFSRRVTAVPSPESEVLRVPCRADLWCRKWTSLSSMLDGSMFEKYLTEDERIDEDWLVQSNPPCAFKKEFKDGCDGLLALLSIDGALHATHGWLVFRPPGTFSAEQKATWLAQMAAVVKTAEREMTPGVGS